MTSPNGTRLIDAYVEWLRERFVASMAGECARITTPFLDRHNDRIEIFVRDCGEEVLLTDDGQVLQDLRMSGVDLSTDRRQALVASILNGYGVQRDGDALVVRARLGDIPRRKHALVQAMLAVGDLYVVSRQSVSSFFLEDVAKFLEERDVRFSRNVQFTGKSGFVHSFDFLIPKSKKAPERLIRAISRADRQNIMPVLFAWQDSKAVRSEDSRGVVVLNDEGRRVSADVLQAIRQYGMEPIPWGEREAFLPTFLN